MLLNVFSVHLFRHCRYAISGLPVSSCSRCQVVLDVIIFPLIVIAAFILGAGMVLLHVCNVSYLISAILSTMIL